MAAPISKRLGRFHLIPSPEGEGWHWIYICRSGVETCRSCKYNTKKMALRGLQRFLLRLKKEVPEIRYRGMLNDDSRPQGPFTIQSVSKCPVLPISE